MSFYIFETGRLEFGNHNHDSTFGFLTVFTSAYVCFFGDISLTCDVHSKTTHNKTIEVRAWCRGRRARTKDEREGDTENATIRARNEILQHFVCFRRGSQWHGIRLLLGGMTKGNWRRGKAWSSCWLSFSLLFISSLYSSSSPFSFLSPFALFVFFIPFLFSVLSPIFILSPFTLSFLFSLFNRSFSVHTFEWLTNISNASSREPSRIAVVFIFQLVVIYSIVSLIDRLTGLLVLHFDVTFSKVSACISFLHACMTKGMGFSTILDLGDLNTTQTWRVSQQRLKIRS